MKRFVLVLLGMIIGGLVVWLINTPPGDPSKGTHHSEIITKEIKDISKLLLVEGTFAEVYSYSDAKRMFYDLISFEKKALLVVNAKASVAYDLEQMDIQIHAENRKVTVMKIPGPEILIEPEFTFYDFQESTFNEFSAEDLNVLHEKAREQLQAGIKKSDLLPAAERRLDEILGNIETMCTAYGWQFEDRTADAQLIPVD